MENRALKVPFDRALLVSRQKGLESEINVTNNIVVKRRVLVVKIENNKVFFSNSRREEIRDKISRVTFRRI